MDKSKIYQPAYHLKENFMVYNLNVLALFQLSGLKVVLVTKQNLLFLVQ